MSPEPDGQRTKKRRAKLLGLGLIQKNVWVPAIFASALMAFALDLRRKAGMLLPTDPHEDDEKAHAKVVSRMVDGETPIIEEAVAKIAKDKHVGKARSRVKR